MGVLAAVGVIVMTVAVLMLMAVLMLVLVAAALAAFFAGNGFDALRGHHERALVAGGLHQPVDPAFKAQAIDEHQLGAPQRARVGGRGLVNVRVAASGHERLHAHLRAAHLPHQVGQDAEAGHHAQRRLFRPGMGGRGGQQRGGDQGGRRKGFHERNSFEA